MLVAVQPGMLGSLLLAATGAASSAGPAVSETQAVAPHNGQTPDFVWSLRAGPTFSGVYYPPYGGDDPYGEGLRLDLAVQRGKEKARFHALLTASWSPFLTTHRGEPVASPGEWALFAGVGFVEDTHPQGPTAFVFEIDGTLGVSQVGQAFNKADGTRGVSQITDFYPLGVRLALGARFAQVWELLLSGDLAGGVAFEPTTFSAVRGSTALLVGRSF
jgi:hypothetical protein